jgi:hypothetical protein
MDLKTETETESVIHAVEADVTPIKTEENRMALLFHGFKAEACAVAGGCLLLGLLLGGFIVNRLMHL